MLLLPLFANYPCSAGFKVDFRLIEQINSIFLWRKLVKYNREVYLKPFCLFLHCCIAAIYTYVLIFSPTFVWTLERNPLSTLRNQLSFPNGFQNSEGTAAAKLAPRSNQKYRQTTKTVFSFCTMMYGKAVNCLNNKEFCSQIESINTHFIKKQCINSFSVKLRNDSK